MIIESKIAGLLAIHVRVDSDKGSHVVAEVRMGDKRVRLEAPIGDLVGIAAKHLDKVSGGSRMILVRSEDL